MSLNKEMIFGLAFGDDNMKMVVLTSYTQQNFSGGSSGSSIVLSTPIYITGIDDISTQKNITITYSDGSSMKINGVYSAEGGTNNRNSLPIKFYMPEGTKIDIPPIGEVYYLPCKWVDV